MRRITLLTAWLAVVAAALAAPLGAGGAKPEKIALPNGFRPEGIAIGKDATFYVGSIPTGAIYRGSLRTGEGEIINPGGAGRASIGVEYHKGKLYVAGGPTGSGFVYSARSGELLKTYRFTTETTTFVNDVAIARGGAYFTDSRRPFLYRVPVDHRHGSKGHGRGGHGKHGRYKPREDDDARSIPLTGDIVYGEGNNANGIEATRDGKKLVIVQTNVGKVFRVDPRSGRAREITLDEPVVNGDGLLLDGRRTLYVVQNRDNKVAVVKLSRRLRSGDVVAHLTDPDFDVPTTVDELGNRLYAVNARFTTPPTPDTPYSIAQFRKFNR
jgi:sugar lactone lactonase YvrE